MRKILKLTFLVCALSVLCNRGRADAIYNVTLDTAPLVGHPAGPFFVELGFTDGSGIGDGNNTVILSNFNFDGGSALGSSVVFGGASGSLDSGVTMTDSSFLNIFSQEFAPGLQLSFSLDVTENDDADRIPDRLTLYLLDSFGVPVPTLALFGNYFLGADLGSGGPVFDEFGSNPTIPLSVGGPVSIPAPTITVVSSVPEPSLECFLAAALVLVGARRRYKRQRN